MILAATAQSAEFTGLVGWVVDVVAALGPLGVALLLALDNVVPVIPSEAVLPFAGYLAARGTISLLVTFVAATIASTASAYVYYELGRRLGHDRASAILTRLPLTDPADVDRGAEWFRRYGPASVFTGRFVPFVRSIVSLPAGTEGMGRVRFGILTAVGSGLWNALWLAAGYVIGEQWRTVGRYSDWFNLAVLAAALLLVGRYVWQRRERLPWT